VQQKAMRASKCARSENWVRPRAAVRVRFGGICGSDIHDFWDGGIGSIRVNDPIILGHEAARTIQALGGDARGLEIGQKVTICPSRPCGRRT
jgi:L-idonate 5-dehydrogenase